MKRLASDAVWKRYRHEITSVARAAVQSQRAVVAFVGGGGGKLLAVASPMADKPAGVRIEWLGPAGARGVIRLNHMAKSGQRHDQKSPSSGSQPVWGS